MERRACPPVEALSPLLLTTSKTKTETSPEVDAQCGVSHHFFVTFVESVFDIQVAGHVGVDFVPAREVDPSVSRSMLDAET
jgi:hypothetical protein